MKDLVAFCKSKGFIFLSSDIYGGLNGFFDYGPLGTELKRNIKNAWWKSMVHDREDIIGLDSSIILHPRVWEASGHVSGFTDPMVDCKVTKARYRADKVFFAPINVQGKLLGYICVTDEEDPQVSAQKKVQALLKANHCKDTPDAFELKPLTQAKPEEFSLIPSPATDHAGDLTPTRQFNLMFKTNVGAVESEASTAFLRPETAQGIFINFKNVLDATRIKVPFGIAQIGKAFRNEITPRNFTFRSREFEQMEIEYFFPAEEALWPELHKQWIETRYQWHQSIGVKPEWLSFDVHQKEDLAHYAKACTDIMFKYPFGVQELEGVAVRGNFDLTQHQTFSGKPISYFDEERKTKYLPYVIEPSVGVDRALLAVLISAYDEDEVNGDKRIVLHFKPQLAPIKIAVFPLVKNNPELVEHARTLFKKLHTRWYTLYDETGSIGKRYRRMDEIGTPWCITVDFDSLEQHTYTLRDRDTTQQTRLSESELIQFFEQHLEA